MSNIIGRKVIDIDGFKFSEDGLKTNLIRMFMLVICADPTEKQIEVMKKLDIKLLDDFGKQFWPPVEKEDDDKSDS